MTPLSLSVSAERVWKALGETDEAYANDLFRKVRPMSREGFDRAIAELERADLIQKGDPPRWEG